MHHGDCRHIPGTTADSLPKCDMLHVPASATICSLCLQVLVQAAGLQLKDPSYLDEAQDSLMAVDGSTGAVQRTSRTSEQLIQVLSQRMQSMPEPLRGSERQGNASEAEPSSSRPARAHSTALDDLFADWQNGRADDAEAQARLQFAPGQRRRSLNAGVQWSRSLRPLQKQPSTQSLSPENSQLEALLRRASGPGSSSVLPSLNIIKSGDRSSAPSKVFLPLPHQQQQQQQHLPDVTAVPKVSALKKSLRPTNLRLFPLNINGTAQDSSPLAPAEGWSVSPTIRGCLSGRIPGAAASTSLSAEGLLLPTPRSAMSKSRQSCAGRGRRMTEPCEGNAAFAAPVALSPRKGRVSEAGACSVKFKLPPLTRQQDEEED